jgi:hypothetical protein
MTDTTDPQADSVADVDTVARRAAQVIASMGADIRALTGQRDRYRSAWCSARERAQAYGEGILRVVKDREAYQEWLRQAEERVPAVPSAPADRAALRDRIAEVIHDDLTNHKVRRDQGLLGIVPRLADAVQAVLPATVDRAAILREAAEICDEAGAVYASKELNDHAAVAYRLMERFLRKADEAEYVATPCDFVGCEPGGEPCSTHERLMAHAEGDHELCEPDCGTSPSRMADEAQQPETQTLPQPEGPEYTPCECDHIEPEHEPDAGACWSCDCEGYRATPSAPLRRSEDDCPGFPEQCPNILPVDPNPPIHYGGIRCGCADQPAVGAQQPKEA